MTTAIMANEAEIKEAMSALKLGNRVEDLLDEIELQRHLKISLEQADRGELIPAEEVEKMIREKFTNGYYAKEEAKKRIAEYRNGR
jgi:hypothetical protein